MMKLKWVFCIILVTLPIFQVQTSLQAANPSQIDNVLDKKVLDDQDKKIIDNYLRDVITALLNERDLATIARYRQAIIARKGTQVQYVQQFNESARNYIMDAFEKAKNLRPLNRQTTVIINLLIIVNGLENVKFAVLPMNKLEDENLSVRYWAVQCLTNPEVISQLNSGDADNPNLPQEITAKFKNMVPKSSPEVLNLMARFAADINIPQGQELLLQITDQRIKNYADWTIQEEFIDANILKLLENKISNPSEKTDVPALAQRFAQLYSYVIQRYIKGKDVLDQSQKSQLKTVIVEIEDKCIRNMVGTQQNMRKAIEQEQLLTLTEEANKLLGSETSEGQLAAKYHFDYGKTNTGSPRTAPLILSDPR
jgi:hypothetical protein